MTRAARGKRNGHEFLPKHIAPSAEPSYREERWQTQAMTGRYEDADVSGEILDPFLPEIERHSGITSAAQLCAEEGPE
jgi:hypothetical protein